MYVVRFTARNAYGTLDGKPQTFDSKPYDTEYEARNRLRFAPPGNQHTAEVVKI